MNALQARLKRYKDNAAATAARYPQSAHYADWRNNRYPKPAILGGRNQINRSETEKGVIYADSFESLPLYAARDAHDINPRLPSGWYTSEFCDETQKGAVLSFRHPHKLSDEGSHLFYVAGTYNSDADGVTVYFDVIHDTPEDAARYADECARIEAEAMREENERYQREREQEEAREQLHDLNKKTLQLIREIKQSRDFTPAICGALTDTIKDALRERRELLTAIAGA